MQRDHMMGFPSLANSSADTEEDYFFNWSNSYPLGVPNRVQAEWDKQAAQLFVPEPDPAHLAFECGNHLLPDGSVKLTDAEIAALAFRKRTLQNAHRIRSGVSCAAGMLRLYDDVQAVRLEDRPENKQLVTLAVDRIAAAFAASGHKLAENVCREYQLTGSFLPAAEGDTSPCDV